MKGFSFVVKKSLGNAEGISQGLKPSLFWVRGGTTEVVPLRDPCACWIRWQTGVENGR